MPSAFDTLAAAFGVPALIEHHKECAEYRPPQESGLPAFSVDGILHKEHGDQEYSDDGNLIKVVRMEFDCPTIALTDHMIFELQRQATVFARGVEWVMDMVRSHWSPSSVTLGLVRRQISRFEEMENHGSVR